MSRGASFNSWGEGASLALVKDPSSDVVMIKIPYTHCSLRCMRLQMHTQAYMQVSLCMQFIVHTKS